MFDSKYKLRLFFVSLVLLIAFSGCQNKPGSSAAFEEGVSLFSEEKYDQAVEVLRLYVYYHPDDFEALFLLGRAFLSLPNGTEDDKYLGRYYLKKAIEAATENNQKAKAADAYEEAKADMNVTSGNASAVLKLAERAAREGDHAKAVRRYLVAARILIQKRQYSDAQGVLQEALNSAQQKETKNAILLGLATMTLINGSPDTTLKTLEKLPKETTSTDLFPALDSDFLKHAAQLLKKSGKRTLLTIWKCELTTEDYKAVKTKLALLKAIDKERYNPPKTELIPLVAKIWSIIGGHLLDISIPRLAKPTLERAQTLFRLAGLVDEATELAESINKCNDALAKIEKAQAQSTKKMDDADSVFDLAESLAESGDFTEASSYYLRAARLYLQDQDYSNCMKALKLGHDKTVEKAARLAIKLSYASLALLNEDPDLALEQLKQIPGDSDIKVIFPALKPQFIKNGAELLKVKRERRLTSFWKADELTEESLGRVRNHFRQIKNYDIERSATQELTSVIIWAKAWQVIGEHLLDLEVLDAAKFSLKRAQLLYMTINLKKEAEALQERIDDCTEHLSS